VIIVGLESLGVASSRAMSGPLEKVPSIHSPSDAFVFPTCRNKPSPYHQSFNDDDMDFEVVPTAYYPQAATSTYGHQH
jgi:hypothetical protein